MNKRKPKYFPSVIYVAMHEDHGTRYLTADKAPEALVSMGERTRLARYTFSDVVTAEGIARLGDEQ